MAAIPPSERLVAALIHAECGHVCIVSDDFQPVNEAAKRRGLADPQWEAITIQCDNAVRRYEAGPCDVCRVDPDAHKAAYERALLNDITNRKENP